MAVGTLYQLLRNSCIRDDLLLHAILVPREKSYPGRAKLSKFEATKQDGFNEETRYSSGSVVQFIFPVLGMDFEIRRTNQLKILFSNRNPSDSISRVSHFSSNWNQRQQYNLRNSSRCPLNDGLRKRLPQSYSLLCKKFSR